MGNPGALAGISTPLRVCFLEQSVSSLGEDRVEGVRLFKMTQVSYGLVQSASPVPHVPLLPFGEAPGVVTGFTPVTLAAC